MSRTQGAALAAISILSLGFWVGCGSDTPNVKPLDPATWCDSVEGGPSGTAGLAVDLSAAHAGVRFFGAEVPDGGSADVALADALDAPDALEDTGIAKTLADYKAPLLNVCVVPANDAPVPVGSVEMKGSVAVIHPGTGELVIPENAAGVAIDLRDLPNRPDLEPALEAAAAKALAADSARSQLLVQVNSGLPTEVSALAGLYGSSFGTLLPAALTGGAAHALPLAVITGPKMASLAAELAGDLRLARLAWIIGSNVRSAVAEACWSGVGEQGVAYRCRELSAGTNRWADAIPADFPLSELDGKLKELPALGTPEGISQKLPNNRPYLALATGIKRPETTTARLGDARAALLTAHGAARLFHPPIDAAAAPLGDRLVEVLEGLGTAPDRATTLAALRHFSEVLADGQAFAEDAQAAAPSELPLVLDQVGGEPVVRVSGDANVHPGDRIAAIDGTSFDDWYQAQAPLLSAATEAFRLQRALELLVQRPSATLTLVDASGTSRDVTVTGQEASVRDAARKNAQRASGLLAGTHLYYLNADGDVLADKDTLVTLMQAAQSADGLVVDLRGTPAVSPYDLAAMIVLTNFKSPLFRIPTWQGQEGLVLAESQSIFNSSPVAFEKKVALLVGPSTVSYAEVAATAVRDATAGDSPVRVKVVGRNTAGTGGNPSAVRLPGGFNFGFTGMEMLHADGTTVFEGVGIAPDVVAEPTQQDLAAGTDTELAAAVTTLDAM